MCTTSRLRLITNHTSARSFLSANWFIRRIFYIYPSIFLNDHILHIIRGNTVAISLSEFLIWVYTYTFVQLHSSNIPNKFIQWHPMNLKIWIKGSRGLIFLFFRARDFLIFSLWIWQISFLFFTLYTIYYGIFTFTQFLSSVSTTRSCRRWVNESAKKVNVDWSNKARQQKDYHKFVLFLFV